MIMSSPMASIQRQSALNLREARHLSNFSSSLREQLTIYAKADYTPEHTIRAVWNVLQRFINAQDTILTPDSPRITEILREQGFIFNERK
jgi:hypothetical protein